MNDSTKVKLNQLAFLTSIFITATGCKLVIQYNYFGLLVLIIGIGLLFFAVTIAANCEFK